MTQTWFTTTTLIAAAFVIGAAAESVRPQVVPTTNSPAVSTTRYIDQSGGMTADEAVNAALKNNGELAALRNERDAARAMVKQAGLRANPSLDIGGTRQTKGMDNSLMVEGMLPLELGGRRSARIKVAERELEIRERAVEERERMLAADVRMKFGESLASVLKLGFADEILTSIFEEYRLVQARVAEGKIAPLEENMTLVEVNRLRSIREAEAGKAEIVFLELRNLMGLKPEDPLRIRGELDNMIAALPTVGEMTARALQTRPDLAAMRSIEELSTARIEQARADGRIDASVRTGYQRMRSGFPLKGFDEAGELMPIENLMHFFTFGVTLELPV
ncbi:MAG: TolC family protein, partial [Pyrinomonadaceae bacterium]|nr:TolC family protein [Pyrinomonadaceae bacterium]